MWCGLLMQKNCTEFNCLLCPTGDFCLKYFIRSLIAILLVNQFKSRTFHKSLWFLSKVDGKMQSLCKRLYIMCMKSLSNGPPIDGLSSGTFVNHSFVNRIYNLRNVEAFAAMGNSVNNGCNIYIYIRIYVYLIYNLSGINA